MKKIPLIAAIASLFFFGGCTAEYVATQPQEEVIVKPNPPEPNLVWVEPDTRWNGTTYIVLPGHWQKHPGVYIHGHWKQSRHGYHWVPGHWK